MSFEWHHPNYYKKLKLKQNSGRSLSLPSKNTVSEDCIPPTMETTVGEVGSFLHTTHTNPKEKNE